jgi:hypothetical protein
MSYLLMGSVLRELFYSLTPHGSKFRGLTWAEGVDGHRHGLVMGFRKGGYALKVLCYARANYPAVLVSWGEAFRDVNDIRDWKLLSYHDASFRESLNDICRALDQLGITMLDGLSDGICMTPINKELSEYLLNEVFRKWQDDREGKVFLLGDQMRDYLLGKHLNFNEVK